MNHVLVLVALKSEITLSWNAISGSVFFLCGRPLQNFMNSIFFVIVAQKYYDWLVAKYSKAKNIVCRGILCNQECIYPKSKYSQITEILALGLHISDLTFCAVCSIF